MSKVIPRENRVELERIAQSYLLQLGRMQAALEHLIESIEAGASGTDLETSKTVGRIRDWLKAVIDLEARLYDQATESERQETSLELDLERARAEIGCRLDRLRACSTEAEVPRCPDC